ncbi:MAG: monooxygenase [Rhodospirillales bacterium]|nr:monooxygenase [Rhodospirillales bacterium]
MKAWHFSENAYPYLPPSDEFESIRVTLPNSNYDPQKGAALYDRYLDEWLIAEDEGMEIMLNEHHQTATCVDPAAPLVLAALARLSKKARLLILGNPVANRRDPVRVAEEMAMVDILSKGRVEVGFVRGVPFEISAANSSPVRMNERQWEAIDLIQKAWTSHDGPFSHEGRFFHHRMVNIWPRPYQAPHPPIWVSTTSASGAAQVGSRGFTQATFLTGYAATRGIFDSYRRGWRAAGRGEDVPVNRLAYAALVYTADTEAAARDGAEKLLWYITANKVPPHFHTPPGYVAAPAMVQAMRKAAAGPHAGLMSMATVDKAIDAGIMFAGTPDQVHRQIAKFHDHIGGFGHLLLMGQAGFLDHAETASGIRSFAREVYPRLKDSFADDAPSGAPAASGNVA